MNLFTLVEKMAPLDKAPVELDGNRCTRGRDKYSKCQACVGACPAGALAIDEGTTTGMPVRLDEKICVGCGACLPVCPVGAISGQDGVNDLLNCVARLEPATLELACATHAAPEKGTLDGATVVRTDRCLAAFGPSVYLWLLGGGVRQLAVRVDACAACPIGKAQPQIERTVSMVSHVMGARGEAERISQITARAVETGPLYARPVQPAKNPPLSRRDLFRTLVSEAPKLAAQMLPAEEKPSPNGTSLPRERRQLLNAIGRLGFTGAHEGLPAAPESATGGIVRLAVNDDCTACGVCARVCPTGAMERKVNGDDFRLRWSPAACTDCGLCFDICDANALRHEGTPTLGEFTGAEPLTLYTATLRQCIRCGAKYAGKSEGNLCPICEYRRQNPLGARSIVRR